MTRSASSPATRCTPQRPLTGPARLVGQRGVHGRGEDRRTLPNPGFHLGAVGDQLLEPWRAVPPAAKVYTPLPGVRFLTPGSVAEGEVAGVDPAPERDSRWPAEGSVKAAASRKPPRTSRAQDNSKPLSPTCRRRRKTLRRARLRVSRAGISRRGCRGPVPGGRALSPHRVKFGPAATHRLGLASSNPPSSLARRGARKELDAGHCAIVAILVCWQSGLSPSRPADPGGANRGSDDSCNRARGSNR